MPETTINTFLSPSHISDHKQNMLTHPCKSNFQRIRKNGGQYSHSTELRDPGLEEQNIRSKSSNLHGCVSIMQDKLLNAVEEF